MTPQTQLLWDKSLGFELDVDASQDDVSIRMVRMPVPADGTRRLAEEPPVELYTLDTMFKSQVDIEGSPGQLNDTTVLLVKDTEGTNLVLRATVECAESGRTRPIALTLPVEVPQDAPEAGGPCPQPPDEDEIDWDDDDVLDQMLTDVPDPSGAGEPAEDDDDPKPSEKGLEALLRALIATTSEEDEDAEIAPEERLFEPGNEEGDEDEMQPTPSSPCVTMENGSSMELTPEQEACSFLRLLIDQGDLALEDGHTADSLVAGMVPLLALKMGPEAKAAAISGWLLDQPAVEELYMDDESLAALLSQW